MLGIGFMCTALAIGESAPDYGREVRPVLADKCYACHGPDEAARKAGLRLDRIDEAIEASTIVPGDAQASELVLRVEARLAKRRMPPPEAKVTLTEDERELLRRWIDAGAPFEAHWAFERLPARVDLPAVADEAWLRKDIDRFVLARLEAEGLAPAPEADRRRWLRRVSFDLTGLPPTPEELTAFVGDDAEEAYELAVDRLLASPRFGERMAVPWLDAARYADSYGYQSDQLSPTWPWRDWVVRAFDANLPYDEFLTQQLAGDLLDEATRETRLATAFNRLHRMTNEGGSIEAEWRLEGVADRVQTLGTAVLGLTLECARCHDHKFDPVTQREYYGLSAYLDSIDEWGMYNDSDRVPTPSLLLPTPEQEQRERELESEVAAREVARDAARGGASARFPAWLEDLPPATGIPGLTGHYPLDSIGEGGALANLARPAKPGRTAAANEVVPGRYGGALRFTGDDAASFPDLGGGLRPTQPFTASLWLWMPEALAEAVLLHNSGGTDVGYHGVELTVRDGRLRLAIVRFWPGNALAVESDDLPRGRWVHVAASYDGHLSAQGMRLYVDGQSQARVLRDRLTKDPQHGGDGLAAGERFRDWGLRGGMLDELRFYERALAPLEVEELRGAGASTSALETADPEELWWVYVGAYDAPSVEADAALRAARAALLAHRTGYVEVPVMEELATPRPTHVLARGAYDAPTDGGTLVERGTPSVLPPFPEGAPRDRLGLARWLTQRDHPLTARVAVNRFWQLFFGQGLVATSDNFGLQGTPPSHPELLDWMARDFVESGWDVKRLCRELVLSATYRQDSRATPELRARDPGDVLLARGPSRRLSAEMLRDAALFAAGLLDEERGGPPVRPYQPPGLWRENNTMSPAYQQDVGQALYRRSLYTVWKRTAPMPSMVLLDAPMREVSCARRQSTSTPLQALVLMGDVQFVEAARALAERTLKEAGEPAARIARIFERLTARPPRPEEAALLAQLLADELDAFHAAPERAAALIAVGEHPADPTLDPAELAATTVVAQAVLNLDATIWRR